jgi:hypothetical protein
MSFPELFSPAAGPSITAVTLTPDASVPLPFDVHMMIRCEDAPGLESALHQRFRSSRVNKVNPRKEFFRVSIEEVASAVREHHGEVEYTADAEALEYMNSRAATDADLEEIEGAYAGAGASAPSTSSDTTGAV